MEEIIEVLTKSNKTISTMESCTGGGVANAITNISGASEVDVKDVTKELREKMCSLVGEIVFNDLCSTSNTTTKLRRS